jgi:hypothetical protein
MQRAMTRISGEVGRAAGDFDAPLGDDALA